MSMRVEVWAFSVRITQEGKEPELVDDKIVVEFGSGRESVISQVKRVLKVPKEAEMNVRCICKNHNAHLLVSELFPAEPSNEELAS